MSEPTASHEPTDRLTRICDAMSDTFDVHPEHQEGDKAIVFLDDGERGGIGIFGYDDENEAMTDLLLHLRAVFKSQGKVMDFLFLDEEGTTRL